MYDAYKAAYKKSGKYPDDKEDDQIVSAVMDRIEDAEIWIPTGEVKKHFRSIKRNLHKWLAKELRQDPEYRIHIKPLDFSLIGILARISKVLASNEIGIFAISTYNTDYVLTKEENFRKALDALRGAGYEVEE